MWSGAAVMLVSGARSPGWASTSHACSAGVGSTLPEASTARTWKVCGPAATVSVRGDVQGAKAPSSSAALELDRRRVVGAGEAERRGAARGLRGRGLDDQRLGRDRVRAGRVAARAVDHVALQRPQRERVQRAVVADRAVAAGVDVDLTVGAFADVDAPGAVVVGDVALEDVARLRDVDAVADVGVGGVALDGAAGAAGRLVADVDAVAVVGAGLVVEQHVGERERLERDAGALGVGGVVALEPVAAGALELDPALVGAQVVAARDVVAGEVQRQAGLGRARDGVLDELVLARLDDLEAAGLLERVALDAVAVGRQAGGAGLGDAEQDAAVVGLELVARDRVRVRAVQRDAVATGADDDVVEHPVVTGVLEPDAVALRSRPARCR